MIVINRCPGCGAPVFSMPYTNYANKKPIFCEYCGNLLFEIPWLKTIFNDSTKKSVETPNTPKNMWWLKSAHSSVYFDHITKYNGFECQDVGFTI